MTDNSLTWSPMAAASFSAASSTSNTKRVIQAQKEENDLMREYNAERAKEQNQWNIEQWQRENQALKAATESERAYNSPAAQKARLHAAGLNADLFYGGSGSVATTSAAGVAASPQMVNSDYGNPTDWSPLLNRKTVGDAIMDSLAIEQARANVRKTNAEAGGAEVSLDEARRRYGYNFTDLEYQKLSKELNLLDSNIKSVDKNTEVKDFELGLQKVYGSKKLQAEIDALKKKYDLDDKQLQFLTDTYAARVSQINSTADVSEINAMLEKYGFGFLQDFVPFVSNVINLYNQLKGGKGGRDNSFGKMTVNGNHVVWE